MGKTFWDDIKTDRLLGKPFLGSYRKFISENIGKIQIWGLQGVWRSIFADNLENGKDQKFLRNILHSGLVT